MSKRVSIVLPEEETSVAEKSASPSASRRASLKSPPLTPARSPVGASSRSLVDGARPAPKRASSISSDFENIVDPLSMTDLFPDLCTRYTKDCCCCHCIAVRQALRQAAYLRSKEGKRHLELKMHMKNLFMDINAMTAMRYKVENMLHNDREWPPSATKSFPITITDVSPISDGFMAIDWYQHDDSYVSHYEIYVDNRLYKRIFDPNITATVIPDVNMKINHNIVMRAIPRKCLGSKANPMDILVRNACCGSLKKAAQNANFCRCGDLTEMEKVEETYKASSCQVMVDFWKDSRFLYIPACSCGKRRCQCVENSC